MADRRMNPVAREQFEPLRMMLRDRFQHLCRDWPTDAFVALVTQMARLQLRYEPYSGLPERTNYPR